MHINTHTRGEFGRFWDIYAHKNVCVKDNISGSSIVLQNYYNLIEMTSNILHIIPFGVGFKCPCKIHLNTQNENLNIFVKI